MAPSAFLLPTPSPYIHTLIVLPTAVQTTPVSIDQARARFGRAMKQLPTDISDEAALVGVPTGSPETQVQATERREHDRANGRMEKNTSPLPSQSSSSLPTGGSRTTGIGEETQEAPVLPASAEPAVSTLSLPVAAGSASGQTGAAEGVDKMEVGEPQLGPFGSGKSFSGETHTEASSNDAAEDILNDEPGASTTTGTIQGAADGVDSVDKMDVNQPQEDVGETKSSGAPAPAATASAPPTTPSTKTNLSTAGNGVRAPIGGAKAGSGATTTAAAAADVMKDSAVRDAVQDAAKGDEGNDVPAKEVTVEDDTNAASEVLARKKGVKDKESTTTTTTMMDQPNPEGVQPKAVAPDVFPPPLEAVIDMRREDAERGSGGGATDRLYGTHCLEREVAARSFFCEQDLLRRRFQAAVDLVELDKAVECSGLELRSGCRTVQTIKMRLKTRWKEGVVLPNGRGLSRCTTKEANQAEQKWQEQVRSVVADHQELLGELMGRQRLEAGALQMSQKMEVPKGSAPLLQIRFAFPRMFQEVSWKNSHVNFCCVFANMNSVHSSQF